MYEQYTEEYILNRMLSQVPDTIDKREGSLIYMALAPAATELAQMYAELDINYNLSFADTATEEYLTRRTAEFGVPRSGYTKAQRKGSFYSGDTLMDVPLEGLYSIGSLIYRVEERLSIGVYVLECQTAGVIGNQQYGSLLPIGYVDGLSRAELQDVLVPGEDWETDDTLRKKYYEAVNEPAFGGNVADYKKKINKMDGVGATKVYPAWSGGGTVKCTIIASDWTAPTSTLIETVQTIIDPEANSGEGLGLAPIGHRVTIAGVTETATNVETTVTLASGMTIGQVQDDIETVIASYLLELRQNWAEQSPIVVRIAQIDARILTVDGIEDISGTEINGSTNNWTLGQDEIPELGAVVINE